MNIMACLEMPSMCQGYMVPAVSDFSNKKTTEALGCIESEGSNATKSAGCLEPAVEDELSKKANDPDAKTNVYDLMQCAVCFNCISPDTVDPDILDTFDCKKVKPSGNWAGDWHEYVNGGAGGGQSGGQQYDWSQWVNGGGDGGGEQAQQGEGGGQQYDWSQWMNGGGDGGGFDYSQWWNNDSGGGGEGGFDWHQFLPGGGN